MQKHPFLIFALFSLFFASACQQSSPEQSTTVTTEEVSVATPATPEKDCIERIIALDNQLWTLRNEAPLERPLSDAVNTYTTAIEQTDFTDCPLAFKEAFMQHITAWRAITVITDKYPDRRGKMLDLFNQLEASEDGEALKAALDKIDATWLEVEAAMKN